MKRKRQAQRMNRCDVCKCKGKMFAPAICKPCAGPTVFWWDSKESLDRVQEIRGLLAVKSKSIVSKENSNEDS